MKKVLANRLKGFTLIELIVVIGIIAVLAAIVILAINPARQFAQARNTRRTNDVKAIADALVQYAAANSGAYPTLGACSGTPTTVTTSNFGTAGTVAILVPAYLNAIPTDPKSNAEVYTACITSSATTGDRITVSLPAANQELNTAITLTR